MGLKRTIPGAERAAAVRVLANQSTQHLLRVLTSGAQGEVLAAAEILTERFLPAIERACRGCLPPREVGDAVVVTAERFFVALTRGHRITSPVGLARTIARGECSRMLARGKRTAHAPISEEDDRDIADLVHVRDRLRVISASVAAADRVVLRDTILDRPSAETATELRTTPGAIDTRRSRLRDSLRKEFDT
jgi:DNA-directed RNA polymerase specialized sigma24 family protein